MCVFMLLITRDDHAWPWALKGHVGREGPRLAGGTEAGEQGSPAQEPVARPL